MSVALSKVSILKADVRLAQAISEFQKELSAEQKTQFCMTRDSSVKVPPNYQDVMRLTEEIDRSASRLLKSRRCFGTRFTNILHAIQQFAALGDVLVGSSQNIIACSVWSLVRVTLLTVVNFSSYLEKLSALLMNIGRSAPRYELLHQLYPRSKSLQSHLSEYFIVVVQICHQLLKMTKKSTFGQLITFPSDADLKTHESELGSISALIKAEVTLMMGQEVREQSSRIRSILRSAEADAERHKLDTYVRVLNACSTYDYEATWKETRKRGTTSWFRQTTAYQTWNSSTESATLVCTGKLGSGKSVMLANLVGDLNLQTQAADCPVAYFFCRHDISDSLLSGTIVRSLGRQLLRSVPDLTLVDERFKKNGQVINSDAVLGVMLSLPRTFNAYFVLDGLDECNEQQRLQLIKELRRIQDAFNLRICVACRSDAGNVPPLLLESLANSSPMPLPDDNPDIKQFIETELYNCIDSGRLMLGDPQLSLEIADVLSAGAQGMFLWVALQIEALSTKLHAGKAYQKRTLELVLAAQRPLTTGELREALSVSPGDDVWNPARHLNNVFSALASCGSLITVEEESLTVRLIHHSVKQFLLSSDPSLTGGITSLDDAHMTMRAIVLTYLNYGVFETQLSTTVTPSIPAQQAPSKIIRSMDTHSTSRNLALKLLKARSHQSVDIGKVVSQTMNHARGQKAQPHDVYKFYSYAKSSWLQHAWLITEKETVAYTMLVKVVTRLLGASATPDKERKDILFWAAKRGHPRIIDLCVEDNVDIESRDSEMRASPLFWAAANGQVTAVQRLAKHGADLDSRDLNNCTALLWAAKHGRNIVVETLIDSGADVEAPDGRGWTPLTFAASNGHEDVVATLLERGARVGARMYSTASGNPLSRAVMNKHKGVARILLDAEADHLRKFPSWAESLIRLHGVCLSTAIQARDLPTLKVLLEHGVDPDTSVGEGDGSALREALSVDDQQMVRMLLDHGADPNLRDLRGRTPLVSAAANGLPIQYEVMINLLLEKGAKLDLKDDEGKTALWYAALYGEGECVKALVANGCDRDVMAADGTTAWHIATNPGHHVRIKILLDNGFDVNLRDGRGRTPLHYAAECGDVEVAKLLLERSDVDPEIVDEKYLTPLDIATDRDNEDVRLLLQVSVQRWQDAMTDASLETPAERRRREAALGLDSQDDDSDDDNSQPLRAVPERASRIRKSKAFNTIQV
ncbi:Ankyrin repeat domain-containing protein 17 [Coniochaeta hoffmannii]|uniref:Ankyrin repeat domain-containing protein 17 n=1 Tax=Coniochaeta hoffmannii TaxID=91930 RepID=A0AA38R7L9_9PEZI|nr:Ankyrin repeat domain-containing protein 17 [Coniochaeta hoffmannii]